MSFAEEVQPAMATTKAQMTKQEKDWRAQDDARTLADSEVIKQDTIRLKDAKVAAKRMAEEEKDKAVAMNRIANMRGKKPLESSSEDDNKPKPKRKPKPKNIHNVFNRL